jgi:hypothetical protein
VTDDVTPQNCAGAPSSRIGADMDHQLFGIARHWLGATAEHRDAGGIQWLLFSSLDSTGNQYWWHLNYVGSPLVSIAIRRKLTPTVSAFYWMPSKGAQNLRHMASQSVIQLVVLYITGCLSVTVCRVFSNRRNIPG